jgi:hypothetical protein
MVDETEVRAPARRAARAAGPGGWRQAGGAQAGLRTADYLLAHRIPRAGAGRC